MKNWEFSFVSAMRVAMRQDKYDVLNLYLKLEKASKKHLTSGEMKEGDSFIVPLENGSMLKQYFYNEYSILTLTRPNKKETTVISKEASIKKEYDYLLGYTHALEDSLLGIGPRYNAEFVHTLQEVKPGQVLVFDNGRSYVCQYNKDDVLRLVKTSDTITIPYLAEFKNSESFSINLTDEIGIQKFYAQVRDMYNDDVRCRVTTTYQAQELLNKYIAGLDKQTKILQLGPNQIRMKKSFLTKEIVYYDEQGNNIPEEQIKVLLGWLNAAPVIKEIKRSTMTSKQEFDDNMIKADIDIAFDSKKYDVAANIINTYCLNNKQDISVNFTSYIKNSKEEFEAVSFVFRYENGSTKLYKLSFHDNNFSKEPKTITPVDFNEFDMFCRQKYEVVYHHIQNRIVQEILPNYPQYHGKFLNQVLHNITEQRIKNQKLMQPEIYVTREDISNIIRSYEDVECERDSP